MPTWTADDFKPKWTAENFSAYSNVLKKKKKKAQEEAAQKRREEAFSETNRETRDAGVRGAYGAKTETPKPVMPGVSTPSVSVSAAEERAAKRTENAGAIRSNYGARQFAQLKDDIKDLQSRINNSRDPSRNLMTELQEMQDQYAAMRKPSEKNASAGQIALNSAVHGLSQFNKGLFSTLDFLLPTELLGEKYDFVSKLNEHYSDDERAYSEKLQESVADRSKAAQVAAEIGSGSVAALPNAILALLSGGTSLGAGAVTAPAASSGVLAAAKAGIQQMMKNPMYWTSLAQTLGNDYEEAKANGAGEVAAIASAFISSMINAGVEVGGGIEALPGNLKTGGKNAVRQWVKSSLEEGGEEVVQSVISGLTQKALYDKDKALFSLTDDNAVFNPINMGEEFALGTAVGGILSGGQTLGISALNAGIDRVNARALARGAQNPATPAIAAPLAQNMSDPIPDTLTRQNAGNREISGLYADMPSEAEIADNKRRVSEFAGALGKAAKTVITDVYDGAAPADLYEAAIMPYYNAGKNGVDIKTVTPVNNGVQLLPKEREMIYNAGEQDALASARNTGYTETNNTNMEVTADEVHLRDSGERAESAYPGGQIRGVEESAGRDPRRQAAALARDSGASALTYGEKVSTASYGIGKGSTTADIYRVTGETASMREAKKLAHKRGLSVFFYGGGDMTIGGDAVRGYISNGRVFIRADDPYYTADQIMRHEIGHDMINKGEVDVNAVRERIDSIYRAQGVEGASQNISEAYAEAYDGALDADAIWVEIICDSLGDMNIFDREFAEMRTLRKPVGKFLSIAKSVTLNSRTDGNAAAVDADGKASRSKYWYPRLTSAEWQLLNKRIEQEISNNENYIDTATKWMYAKSSGVEVFAIYGIGDGTEATVLFAEGSKNAHADALYADEILRRIESGTVRTARDINRYFEAMRRKPSNNNAYHDDAERGKPTDGTGGIPETNDGNLSGGRNDNEQSADNLDDGEASRRVSSFEELREENAELKEQFRELKAALKSKTSQAEYWKGQTRRTEEVTARQSDVNRLARQLVSDTQSTVKAADIAPQLKDLADIIVRGDENAPEWVEVKDRSIEIARELVTNAQEIVNSDDLQTYDEIKRTVHGMRIALSEEDRADIPDFNNFRKRNFGRFTLASDGMSMDAAYSALREQFGDGYFPADITAPADQIMHIAETLAGMQAIFNNPFDMDMAAAVEYTANDILRALMGGEVRQTAPTYADRQAAKLDALKRKNAQKVSELRSGSKRKALRQKIVRHANELSKKLRKPTDKKHVPDKLREVTARALEVINLGSSFDVAVTDSGKTKRVPVGTQYAEATERTKAFRKLRDEYRAIVKDPSVGLIEDPYLLGAEGETGLLDKVAEYMDTPIDALNIDQLNDVWALIKHVEHAISTAGKMLSESKFERTSELVDAFKADAKERRNMGMIDGGILLEVTDPLTFFSRFGDTGKAIYRILRNAQDKQAQMLKEIADKTNALMTAKQVNEARKERHTFTTESGKQLILTTAHIMDLYNLARRDAAKQHLAVGGVRQPQISRNGTQKRIPRGTEAIPLTLKDISDIVSTLSVEYRTIAEGLQSLMANELAEWGNEAALAVFGYSKFNDKDYWTIRSAHEEVETTAENNTENVKSLKNVGLAKNVVPNANNGVNLDDAFRVFGKHAADMIKYSAWLAPIEDVTRFYNFRDRKSMQTVKDMVTRVAGDGGQGYWEQLINDIQNGITGKRNTELDRLVDGLIGRGKGAAIAGNARVVIQQPTAYVRAAAVIDPVSMAKGVKGGVVSGRGWTKARKWAGIAQIKAVGGFDQGSARSVEQQFYNTASALDKINALFSWGAERADALTWGALWNACEHEVAKTVSLDEVGETEFLRRTKELFTEVVEQTQVVDGVLQRTQLARNGDRARKMATSFMGEPLKSLNMFLRAYDEYRYTLTPAKRKAAGKKLARTLGTLVVTNTVNAFAQSLIDGLRDDDKDKKYWGRVWEAFIGIDFSDDELTSWKKFTGFATGNFGSTLNPLTYFPYARDLVSMLQGFDVYRADADVIRHVITSAFSFAKSVGGKGSKTVAYAFLDFAGAASGMLGIPVKNLVRDILAGFDTYVRASKNYALMYEFEKFKYRVTGDGNTNRFVSILYKAKQSEDAAVYERIYNDLIKSGLTEEQIKNGMERVMKKAEGVTAVEDLSERYLSPARQDKYDSTLSKMKNSSVWGKATREQRDDISNTLYEIVAETDRGETLQERIDGGAQYGINISDYLLFELASDIADDQNKDKDKRNDHIDQDERERAVKMLTGLSRDAKAYLSDKKWAKSDDNP